MNIENLLFSIRQKKDYDRIEELKKRKRFRLWKIGHEVEDKKDWWNVANMLTPSLIFDSQPSPISISMLWINDVAYYEEGWICGVTWAGTAYKEYRDLCAKASESKKAAKQLLKKAEVITEFQIPEDPSMRKLFIQIARLYADEKLNYNGVLEE